MYPGKVGTSKLMIKYFRITFYLLISLLVVGCSEDWKCETAEKSMYSVSSSGQIGAADKGCTCEQIKNFELKQFGQVDEDALKRDFGC
jgi:hypothetical protein